MSKKLLEKAYNLGTREAIKSPLENRYCAILVLKNKIVSHAYNTHKGPYINNNTKQCILCPQ